MSVTSGFFNSISGDRRYNAEQLSHLVDSLINDGIFANIGTGFSVKADSGNDITVGIGRCWFNSTWLLNDAILPITLDSSEILLNRYDAIVIEIDRRDSVRAGSIKVIKGTPSSSPQKPSMVKETEIHQYPLAYIYRKAESSEVTQADIENRIGTSDCPYVTGILSILSIDNIVAQWEAEMNQWTTERQVSFDDWFNSVKNTLGDDAATNLASRILELENKLGNNYIRVVESLPENPDANTIYFIKEGNRLPGGGAN